MLNNLNCEKSKNSITVTHNDGSKVIINTNGNKINMDDNIYLFYEDDKYLSHNFFKWFNEKYYKIKKISVKERNVLLGIYRKELRECDAEFDFKYSITGFNKGLPVNILQKNVRIRGKNIQGYEIKNKELYSPGFFIENEI